MKSFVRGMLSIIALFGMFASFTTPASATDRVQWLYALQPPSSWLNVLQRDQRLGQGQLIFDLLGRGTSGYYSNLSVTPAGGLTVQVGPTNTNGQGSLYQYLADDTSTFGGGTYGSATALPADPTQIYLQGLANSNLTAITVSAGTSGGQSISNLIECQVQITDTTSQSVNFVSAAGVLTPGTANRDRRDLIVCQNKASASATSPTTPTVDTGYVAIAAVVVPNGTATVTTGMITAQTAQQFNGFLQPTVAGASALDTSSTNQTKTGGLTAGGVLSTAAISAATGYIDTTTYGSGFNDVLIFNSGTVSGTTRIGASSGPASVGVTSSALYVDNGDSTALLTLDATGSLGIANNLNVGATFNIQPSSATNCLVFSGAFSITCPEISNADDGGLNLSIANTSALGYRFFTYATGSSLKENVAFPTSNGIQTDSASGGTLSYVAPVYSSSGGVEPATMHSVEGFCTFSGTTCTSTLTGAAVFTSGSSFACNANSGSTGVNVWTTSTSGSTVSLTAASSISTSVTYVCTGY